MANSLKQDIKGKVVVVRASEYKDKNYPLEKRIGRATGGFGCSPTTGGNAVFVDFAAGGSYRVEGWMLERLGTEEEFLAVQEKYASVRCPKCNGKGHYDRKLTPTEWAQKMVEGKDSIKTINSMKMMVLVCEKCQGEGVIG